MRTWPRRPMQAPGQVCLPELESKWQQAEKLEVEVLELRLPVACTRVVPVQLVLPNFS